MKRQDKIAYWPAAGFLLLLIMTSGQAQAKTMVFSRSSAAQQDNNYDVTFHVRVVDAPCRLNPGDANIDVDLGETSTRELQVDNHGAWRDFAIQLTGCSTETRQDVAVTFSGPEAGGAAGRLALDPASIAQGAAIGIYYAERLLALNESTPWMHLEAGDNRLNFRARLEKISDERLTAGDYTASANFKLSYQ
ncbi:type 1 fimbrial protein [Affinibrenneria salicis]|uniref:Type 1 fimbrial protein n=1 Tax=Affinibrenneria salicis TaxID=2590031 RepID=A0A5J5FV38_9GAMM|nr:fimbrial protein [Affinibrenneria salicis]KAA8997632.1 type 1 fimbrial protein [Affinibrenneria salicis]